MSTRSLNKVQLIGNLTRDPELRYTPQGTAVCSMGLATNRTWVTENGDRKEDVEFHRVVAWAKLAELCGQLLFKGRKVYVEGRLQTRQWVGQDNQQRSTTEVVIDDMIILDSRQRGTNNDSSEGGYDDDYDYSQVDYGNDYGNNNNNNSPSAKSDDVKPKKSPQKDQSDQSDDDDLPF